ncbi:hypothetical protein BDR26DRAFT_850714 [Obelidium mucronatum]|nr:hypothetical protein BDR26DRAFT_850714 [Obelidium mucronatum]
MCAFMDKTLFKQTPSPAFLWRPDPRLSPSNTEIESCPPLSPAGSASPNHSPICHSNTNWLNQDQDQKPTLPPLSQLLSALASQAAVIPFTLPARCILPSTPLIQPPAASTPNIQTCIIRPIPITSYNQTRYQVEVPGGLCKTSSRPCSNAEFKLTIHQLNLLKKAFDANDTPNVAEYDRISTELQIPRKFLLTW